LGKEREAFRPEFSSQQGFFVETDSSRRRPRESLTGGQQLSAPFMIPGEIHLSNRYLMIAAAISIAAGTPAFATAAAPAAAPKPAPSAAPKETTRAQFVANIQSRFNAVDTNHDGFLDANEVAAAQQKELQQARAVEQQRLEAEFNKLDTNHDGQLSKAEFMAAAPPLQLRETAQKIIGAIDTNKDGKISLQEYEAGPLANFSKLDINHDGTVSPEEMEAARAARAPKKP
jgi:Ca2+-binding EF-hand superfamily protein